MALDPQMQQFLSALQGITNSIGKSSFAASSAEARAMSVQQKEEKILLDKEYNNTNSLESALKYYNQVLKKGERGADQQLALNRTSSRLFDHMISGAKTMEDVQKGIPAAYEKVFKTMESDQTTEFGKLRGKFAGTLDDVLKIQERHSIVADASSGVARALEELSIQSKRSAADLSRNKATIMKLDKSYVEQLRAMGANKDELKNITHTYEAMKKPGADVKSLLDKLVGSLQRVGAAADAEAKSIEKTNRLAAFEQMKGAGIGKQLKGGLGESVGKLGGGKVGEIMGVGKAGMAAGGMGTALSGVMSMMGGMLAKAIGGAIVGLLISVAGTQMAIAKTAMEKGVKPFSTIAGQLILTTNQLQEVDAVNKRAIASMDTGYKGFHDALIQHSEDFRTLAGGDALEGAKLSGQMITFMKTIGASSESAGGLDAGLTEMSAGLRDLRDKTDITASEFMGFSEGLIRDSVVREGMQKLTEKDRKGLIKSTMAITANAEAMGLAKDEALSYATTMAKLSVGSGQTYSDQIKSAANFRSAMGLMAMSLRSTVGGGERLNRTFDLMSRAGTLSGKEMQELGKNMGEYGKDYYQLQQKLATSNSEQERVGIRLQMEQIKKVVDQAGGPAAEAFHKSIDAAAQQQIAATGKGLETLKDVQKDPQVRMGDALNKGNQMLGVISSDVTGIFGILQHPIKSFFGSTPEEKAAEAHRASLARGGNVAVEGAAGGMLGYLRDVNKNVAGLSEKQQGAYAQLIGKQQAGGTMTAIEKQQLAAYEFAIGKQIAEVRKTSGLNVEQFDAALRDTQKELGEGEQNKLAAISKMSADNLSVAIKEYQDEHKEVLQQIAETVKQGNQIAKEQIQTTKGEAEVTRVTDTKNNNKAIRSKQLADKKNEGNCFRQV